MGFGDAINIGPYRLVSQSFTQDSNAELRHGVCTAGCLSSDGKKVTQLAPEKRFYRASQTQLDDGGAALDAAQRDLYVIYEGKNPDTGKPIIKVFLNPLMLDLDRRLDCGGGDLLALAPNLTRTGGAGCGQTSGAGAWLRFIMLEGWMRLWWFVCWRW